MSGGNERLKGVQVHRPIIYGSHARLLTEEEKANAPVGHTHKWTIFLTSAATPPPEPRTASSSNEPPPIDVDYLPGGEDDMSYVIKRVVFRLHETYPNPNRMCERPPYKVTETGWGEFTVNIKITFVPEAGEKALSLQHPIKLHHWGEPIEPPPPPTETPVSTPGPEKEVKVETATGSEEIPDTPATATDTPAPPSVPPLPPSAAYPVHAWQYDELVFCDPPANFLAMMDENAPTPLPAKNRRPRDQREEHELKKGKKKVKVKLASTSRAGTATPSRAGTPRGGTPAVGTPLSLGLGAGPTGEAGSADVPLEYSLEMEKAEHARLNEIRMRIVEQMDRWRERLIAQEKELTRVKADMK